MGSVDACNLFTVKGEKGLPAEEFFPEASNESQAEDAAALHRGFVDATKLMTVNVEECFPGEALNEEGRMQLET